MRSIVPASLFVALTACAGGAVAEPQSGEEALAGPPGEAPGPEVGRGRHGERRIAKLTEALDLSEEQVAQIRRIFAEQPHGGREARGAIHERIAAVLTPEQRAKLEQLPVERRLHRLTELLVLSEQQAGQVRTILQETFAQERQFRAQGADAREQHLALRTRTRERIAAVLTPEQRATFEQMPERGFGHGGRGHRGGRGRHHSGGPGGFDRDPANQVDPI